MSTRLHAVAPWPAFPLILGGGLCATVLLAPHLGTTAATAVAANTCVMAMILCEALWPYEAAWRRSHGDVLTDLAHALVSGIGVSQLLRAATQTASVAAATTLAGWFPGGLWPVAWPLWGQLALALTIAEFFQYWLHRLQHEQDWLWRFHAVHHSAPRLYWLNAARFHPVDIALLYVTGYLPLIALGCPPLVIALFAVFDAVFGMLQHANIDVRLGPLNYVFSMAEPHRWHHSRRLVEANTNYGSNLIVWDVVFRTFFLPRDRRPPVEIGIADMPAFPQRYLGQLAAPLRWRSLPRAVVASRGQVAADGDRRGALQAGP
jgi:sterol desaturase/sphingolipid hydroxylase (fatty acid hydroxylase superfamily)